MPIDVATMTRPLITLPGATLQCYADPAATAQAAGDYILRCATMTLAQRPTFRIVLAGGATPQLTYRWLGQAQQDWARWRFYCGDERCVPPTHHERNSQMIWDEWLQPLGVAPAQVFAIPAELGAAAAAAAYAPVIAAALPFDVVLLGMGADGHTASLFPNQAIPPQALVMPVLAAPKPPPERVSLTPQALAQTTHLLILITGQQKRAALYAWHSGAMLPVAQVAARAAQTVVFCDRAALPNDAL